MYRGDKIAAADKDGFYKELFKQLNSLLSLEDDWIANLANVSSLLFYQMEEVNWLGFYLVSGEKQLVVGPFQGKPACTRIDFGDGVCGTTAEKRETVIVDDVHQFPGHIACDEASKSEIVVPIFSDDEKLIGVLDVDSPVEARFDETDKKHLEDIVELVVQESNIT